MALKITYATMSADNEELNSAYEKAAIDVQARLGQTHGVMVNGESRPDRDLYEEVSPINRDLLIGKGFLAGEVVWAFQRHDRVVVPHALEIRVAPGCAR